MPEAAKPGWTCRWIEQAREAHPEWEQGAGRRKPGLLQRWVERHEARCPHCRAEREAWNRVLAALRSSRLGPAPAHILDSVTARIAQERAAGALGSRGAPPALIPEAESSSWADRAGGWDLGQAAAWAAGAVALAGAASARASLWAAWWPARAELWEFVERLAGAARLRWNDVAGVLEAVPTGLQPYLVAGLWCAVGLSAAVASTALAAKLSER